MNTSSQRPPPGKRSPDEPELTQEESVPLDGPDKAGGDMMRTVRNDKRQDRGDAERKTPGKA